MYGSLHCNHFSLHSKVIDCAFIALTPLSCLTINDFAVQAEMVEAETSINT